MVNGTTTRPVRLVPVWFTVAVVTLLVFFTLLFAGIGAAASGPMAASMLLLAVATGGCLVAAFASLTRRRRRVQLTPTPDGEVVVSSPLLLTVGLLLAWAALLAVALLWGWVAVTDLGQIESPGMTLVGVLGAVATVPDLVRLLTGRLHRWRLALASEGLAYRGYRTSVLVPWGEVREVGIQGRGPAGVRVETRDGPVVLPATVFTVPAEQLVEEIRARASRR